MYSRYSGDSESGDMWNQTVMGLIQAFWYVTACISVSGVHDFQHFEGSVASSSGVKQSVFILGLLDPQHEGTKTAQNVRIY